MTDVGKNKPLIENNSSSSSGIKSIVTQLIKHNTDNQQLTTNCDQISEHENRLPIQSIEKSPPVVVVVGAGATQAAIRPVKCYYIDELGFYRHLDPEQRQYVCSNVSATNLIRKSIYRDSAAAATSVSNRVKLHLQQESQISTADGGYEICFKAMRKDLGISHFDRIDNYESWKKNWDEFMRVKLITNQPVTLNRELKQRVRAGIPHDYRCKVWSALIRMRTRTIRAQFGDDIYEAIVRDFVSKVEIPNYNNQFENQEQEDFNNNNDKLNINKQNRKIIGNNGGQRRSSYLSSSPLSTSTTTTTTTTSIIAADKQQQQKSTTSRMNNNNQVYSSQRPLVAETQIDKCFKQIELDLLRTLPNNRHFDDPNSRGIQRVRRVLRAYACFNQSVGYCQGMNRLAAIALLVLPEIEAFWCLVAIIQCIMPKDYYLKPWLAQVDCCVLSDLLEKKMPKLHKHLVKNDIQLTLFTWFFTIFVDGFRPELMLRIWDCFLLEGDKVLFRFALSILYISQDDLLEMNDFSTMSSHLSKLVSTRQLDMERLIETFNSMNPLSSATLESRREFHRNKMRTMIEE